ncbi:MAG: ABC transporter substrate-binding protein, partial [Phycisphaerae bacterium]
MKIAAFSLLAAAGLAAPALAEGDISLMISGGQLVSTKVSVGGDALGYIGITINVGNGDRARTPLGQSAKVREALEISIDRDIVNQVVYAGEFVTSAKWVQPASPFFINDLPAPARDVARARRLLAEAGTPNPVVNLMIPNNPDLRQVGEVIQSMAREAGFDIR